MACTGSRHHYLYRPSAEGHRLRAPRAWKGISNSVSSRHSSMQWLKKDAFSRLRASMPAPSTRPRVSEMSDDKLWFARCSMAFVIPDSALRIEPTRRADYRHVHQARSQSGLRYESGKTNYWPYWNNYAEPLEKMLRKRLKAVTPTSKSRTAWDIYRRKSSTGRSINERDFEKSSGYTVVYSPDFSTAPGHQVSMKADSTAFDPKYELLSISKEELQRASKITRVSMLSGTPTKPEHSTSQTWATAAQLSSKRPAS